MTYYLHYLQGLAYESAPDYDYIRTLYQEMFNATGANENTITYDWDAPLLPTANFSTSTGGMVGGGGDGTMDMSVSLPACAPTAVTTTNPDQSFTPMMIDPCDHHVDILPPLVQMGTAASAAEPENGSLQYQLSPSHQQHQHSTASGTLTLKRSYIHLKKKLVQYSPEEQQHQAHSLQQANMMGKPPQPQHQPLEPRYVLLYLSIFIYTYLLTIISFLRQASCRRSARSLYFQNLFLYEGSWKETYKIIYFIKEQLMAAEIRVVFPTFQC